MEIPKNDSASSRKSRASQGGRAAETGGSGCDAVEPSYGATISIRAKHEGWVPAGKLAVSQAWPWASVLLDKMPVGMLQFEKSEEQRIFQE